MGIFSKLLTAGVAVGLTGLAAKSIHDTHKENQKEKERQNTPCCFTVPLTEEHFEQIAIDASKTIKKKHISIEVYGAKIYGTVESQSGLSTWDFTIDFNDYGKITGDYWLWSENTDSKIPNHIAELISDTVIDILY